MFNAPFLWRHRVTYSDCTAGNHVYYGRFLDILEEARGEMFRSAGITFLQLQQEDTVFPVIECRLSYKAPAHYDEVLEISVWLVAAEGVRLEFRYKINGPGGAPVLAGETLHACTTLAGKVRRVPCQVRQLCRHEERQGEPTPPPAYRG